MRPFRFLHTADLHLGTPFRGLQKDIPAPFAQQVTAAAQNVARRIVDIAISEHVDFVTIAGDLFDTEAAGMSVQFELMRGFERLDSENIPVFMIHGNHDPLVKNRFLRWPSNVYVFDIAPATILEGYQVPSTVLELDVNTHIQVSGFSYGSAAMYTPMADYFVRSAGVDFAIGLYHGVIGQDGDHANYCPAKVDDLVKRGFDFWGLGHIHKPQVVRAQNPVILYPGNPQGRHIREDGVRGCSLIDISANGKAQTTFLPVSSIVWNRMEVSVDGCVSIESVRETIVQELASYVQLQKLPNIVRIAVVGQTDAHPELDEEVLWSILQEEVLARHWPIYIERIELQTLPAMDEQVLIHSDSYAGSILRMVQAYECDITLARSELLPELEDVFHGANGLALDSLADDAVKRLLQEAKRQLTRYLVSPNEVDA